MTSRRPISDQTLANQLLTIIDRCGCCILTVSLIISTDLHLFQMNSPIEKIVKIKSQRFVGVCGFEGERFKCCSCWNEVEKKATRSSRQPCRVHAIAREMYENIPQTLRNRNDS